MVKNIMTFCILLIIGCRVSRNEYNMVRVPISRFSIKPNANEEVYRMIDTSSVYLQVAVNGEDSIRSNTGKLVAVIPLKIGLKFYKNGRVAQFRGFDIKEISSSNPEKARQGLYELKNGWLSAEFVYHSPQAGIFLGKDKVEVRGDTILLTDKTYEYKYVKEKLPAEFLIFQPRW